MTEQQQKQYHNWLTANELQTKHDVPLWTLYRWAEKLQEHNLAIKIGASEAGKGGGMWLVSPHGAQFLISRKGRRGNTGQQALAALQLYAALERMGDFEPISIDSRGVLRLAVKVDDND